VPAIARSVRRRARAKRTQPCARGPTDRRRVSRNGSPADRRDADRSQARQSLRARAWPRPALRQGLPRRWRYRSGALLICPTMRQTRKPAMPPSWAPFWRGKIKAYPIQTFRAPRDRRNAAMKIPVSRKIITPRHTDRTRMRDYSLGEPTCCNRRVDMARLSTARCLRFVFRIGRK
jgi:hypothetical protein